MQHESLSFLVLHDAPRFGSLDATRQLTEAVLKFHREHYAQAPESVLMAYNNSQYDSLMDFEVFRKRLVSSAGAALAALQRGTCFVIFFLRFTVYI